MEKILNDCIVTSRKGGAVLSPQYDKLCIFCHYDSDNQIADYVVECVSALHRAGCHVYFVSNCPIIDDIYLNRIEPYVAHILLRNNQGYDFGAYFTGYAFAKDEQHSLDHYKSILFVNDSVYGPFYPLEEVFNQMNSSRFDLWGLTDSFNGKYHIQSYFWVFKNEPKVREVLDSYLDPFEMIDDKGAVVGYYEVGICSKMLRNGFNIGAMCPSERVICFEKWQSDDPHIAQLKENIKATVKSKINVIKRIRAAFSKNRKLKYYHQVHSDLHAYCTGIYGSWYTLVKYFSCPFIKVSLLKGINTYHYHECLYACVLEELYPNYSLDLIEGHLKRVRSWGKK
ncbi:MAG: hypothetical protein IPP74_00795 [Alphaproteobacteria bacterium]|nr:hypothetical protein [Alphaproteobacteria bacterium]